MNKGALCGSRAWFEPWVFLWCALATLLSQQAASASPRLPWPPIPESTPLLWQESFDESYYFGATNEFVTLSNCCTVVESWSGYALQRSGANVEPFVVAAVASERTNLASAGSGAIRFWFRPYWTSQVIEGGSGPGAGGRFLELINGESVLWSLEVSADGNEVSYSVPTRRYYSPPQLTG